MLLATWSTVNLIIYKVIVKNMKGNFTHIKAEDLNQIDLQLSEVYDLLFNGGTPKGN